MGVDTKMDFVFNKYQGENCDQKRTNTFYSVLGCIKNSLKDTYKDFQAVDCSGIHCRAMWLRFTDGDDLRQIFMCLDCETDQLDKLEIKPSEALVHFSLGCWGNSTKIMETLGQAIIKEMSGRVYIDFNDCDSISTDVFLTSAAGQK